MDSEILSNIRLYINDNTEPYNFSDEQIESIYNNQSSNFYLTIAEIWLIKSSMVSENNTTSFSLGNESYSFSDTKQSCLDNYSLYLSKANQSVKSLFSGNVDVEDEEETNYSNLMGGSYSAEPNRD